MEMKKRNGIGVVEWTSTIPLRWPGQDAQVSLQPISAHERPHLSREESENLETFEVCRCAG